MRYSIRFVVWMEDLKSRRCFIDALIGVLGCGNLLKSYKTLSEQTGYTVARIKQAVKRNHARKRFIKQNNYIILDKRSYNKSEIRGVRRDLFCKHGIATPEPLRHRGHYFLTLYAPNSYCSCIVDPGDKGTIDHLTQHVRGGRCYLRPVDLRLQKLFKTGARLWFFNEGVYDFEDYLNDNGFKNI
jgi:hypothetical protein